MSESWNRNFNTYKLFIIFIIYAINSFVLKVKNPWSDPHIYALIIKLLGHFNSSHAALQLLPTSSVVTSKIHQNLFITLLLASKAEDMLVKQPCYIRTKVYRLYRKMTIYGSGSALFAYVPFLGFSTNEGLRLEWHLSQMGQNYHKFWGKQSHQDLNIVGYGKSNPWLYNPL